MLGVFSVGNFAPDRKDGRDNLKVKQAVKRLLYESPKGRLRGA